MRWGLGVLLCLGLLGSRASATETISYGYDDLGRLTTSSTSGSVNNGLGAAVSYDAGGNRTNYTVTGSSGTGSDPGSTTYDTDAAAYFAAMSSQPDPTRKGLINDLITGLKADGLWTKISWLSLLASHNTQSALLNVKDPTKSFSVVNSPTFTNDRGYAGNGSTSYLDAGEIGTASGIYALNSSFLALWCNNAGSGTFRISLGNGGLSYSSLFSTSGTLIGYTSHTTSVSGTISTATGFNLITRTSSSASALYHNTTSVSTSSNATNTPIVGNMRALDSADGRHAVVAWGSGLSSTDATNLYNRLNTYLTAIGAN